MAYPTKKPYKKPKTVKQAAANAAHGALYRQQILEEKEGRKTNNKVKYTAAKKATAKKKSNANKTLKAAKKEHDKTTGYFTGKPIKKKAVKKKAPTVRKKLAIPKKKK